MDPREVPFWRFLGNWLREKDWTQTQLADAIDVHQTVVSKWLHADGRRRSRPGRQAMLRLASVLEMSSADISAMILNDQAELDRSKAARPPFPQDEDVQAPVQAELDARLAKLGNTLSKYPRAVWLAVLEANERMADALAHSAEPPVSAPEKGRVSASDQGQTGESSNDRGPFTLRKRLAEPALA